jgi:hypothetical protein
MADGRYIKVARLDTYYALHGVSAPLTGAPITRASNSGLHHRCACLRLWVGVAVGP